MRSKIATKRVTDPTLINGKVKPPRLYKAEPRAGPKKKKICAIILLFIIVESPWHWRIFLETKDSLKD